MFRRLFKKNTIENKKQDKQSSIHPISDDLDVVFLPKLKFVRQSKPSDSISPRYYDIVQKGRSHYNRKWYEKAKDEFLKAYDFKYKEDSYYTHLIRAYRKTVDRLIEKKRYLIAIDMFEEMFEKCPNYSITDLKKYNKIAKLLNSSGKGVFEIKELIVKEIEEYKIDSQEITFLSESKKPRGFKILKSDNTTYSDFLKFSDFITHKISYISIQGNKISYKLDFCEKEMSINPYRFKDTSDNKHFITSTTELDIYVFNWEFDKIKHFNARRYSDDYSELRCVDMSKDLSMFLFTNIDKAYLLDSKLRNILTWVAPHKEGFEKRKSEEHNGINEDVKKNLSILGLSDKPSQEEIKKSFRKLIIQHHPDKNNSPTAHEKTRELIQAYEFLTGEKAQSALDGIEEFDYYWVDTKNTTKFESYGFSFEMSFTLGSGEDWIYGTGISDDGQRIYLGCYSGKIYQINQSGKIQKKFIIPEDKTGVYGSTNPISSIREFKDRLYILSSWYLYILQNNQVVKYLPVNDGNLKWFDDGFVLFDKKEIKIYNLDGKFIGKINFKQNINQISFFDNLFIIVTISKTYCFKWTKNAP